MKKIINLKHYTYVLFFSFKICCKIPLSFLQAWHCMRSSSFLCCSVNLQWKKTHTGKTDKRNTLDDLVQSYERHTKKLQLFLNKNRYYCNADKILCFVIVNLETPSEQWEFKIELFWFFFMSIIICAIFLHLVISFNISFREAKYILSSKIS